MTNRTTSDPQPTPARHRRKGSDHDSNHQHTADHEGHSGTEDTSPGNDHDGTQSDHPSSSSTELETDRPRYDRPSTPARRQSETYAEEQTRLDAEAVERWAVIVADWPPLPEERIRSLAVILNRIDARQRDNQPREPAEDGPPD